MARKQENVRQWQKDKKNESITTIIATLSQNDKLLYGEIVRKTKLSKATLTARLNEMMQSGKVGRLEDKTAKYPYPVYYFLKEQDPLLAKIQQVTTNIIKVADTEFRETKNPETYFHLMNNLTNTMLLNMIPLIKDLAENDKIPREEAIEYSNAFLSIRVFAPFEHFARQFLSTAQEIESGRVASAP